MIEILGTSLLPDGHRLLTFALAGLLLNLVPGPDMTYVIASAVRGGSRCGSGAAIGISVGSLVHVCAAALGLSALLATSASSFMLVKYVGAAYLLYLAVVNLKSATQHDARASHASPISCFRSGILINVLNPKVALFFLAFLPQFVESNAAVPAVQIIGLGLWFNAVGTLVNLIVAVLAARAKRVVAGGGAVSRYGRWLVSGLFALFAVRLATSAAVPAR